MSFNTGNGSNVDDKNLFVADEFVRIKLETEVVDQSVLVATYSMVDEDHDVGMWLTHELQKDKRVSFAAYNIPHPQESLMKLRFHTHPSIDPRQILNDAIHNCLDKIDAIAKQLSVPQTTFKPAA
jgi:DNA-directed RNA polymerase subunit L